MLIDPKYYVGITKAAERLGIPTNTIRERLKTGNVVGAIYIDGHIYFDTRQLTRELWNIRAYRKL